MLSKYMLRKGKESRVILFLDCENKKKKKHEEKDPTLSLLTQQSVQPVTFASFWWDDDELPPMTVMNYNKNSEKGLSDAVYSHRNHLSFCKMYGHSWWNRLLIVFQFTDNSVKINKEPG